MTLCGELLDPFSHDDGAFCDETATHRVLIEGTKNPHKPYDACERHARQHADAARRDYKHDARTITITVVPLDPTP